MESKTYCVEQSFLPEVFHPPVSLSFVFWQGFLQVQLIHPERQKFKWYSNTTTRSHRDKNKCTNLIGSHYSLLIYKCAPWTQETLNVLRFVIFISFSFVKRSFGSWFKYSLSTSFLQGYFWTNDFRTLNSTCINTWVKCKACNSSRKGDGTHKIKQYMLLTESYLQWSWHRNSSIIQQDSINIPTISSS